MTSPISTIKPGMFGLTVIGGTVGKLVRFGQRIVERQDYNYTHAFLVVSEDTVIEAEPGGAIISPLSKYTERTDVLFSDLPIKLALADTKKAWENVGFNSNLAAAEQSYEDVLRRRVVNFGKQCEGIGYNYLDYFALALERFNIHIAPVQKRIERQDRMICSQLVDWAYMQVDIHLFDDGRLPFDVTPGDLEGFVRSHDA